MAKCKSRPSSDWSARQISMFYIARGSRSTHQFVSASTCVSDVGFVFSRIASCREGHSEAKDLCEGLDGRQLRLSKNGGIVRGDRMKPGAAIVARWMWWCGDVGM